MKKPGLILCILLWAITVYGQLPKGKILYSSGKAGEGGYELHIINSDGTSNTLWASSKTNIDFSDCLNNKVAFMQKDDTDAGYSIIVITTGNKQRKTLIHNQQVCNPKWQPGGRHIAYEYFTANGTGQIWIMDSSGTNGRLLTDNARHPYWYADGSKLLFTRDFEVYSYTIGTGREQQLTHLALQHLSAKWPAISPDGKKIVFKYYTGESMLTAEGIAVYDLQTGSLRKIQNCDIPSWSNDNHYIVCNCDKGKNATLPQVAIINIETGSKTFITDNKNGNYFPAWVK